MVDLHHVGMKGKNTIGFDKFQEGNVYAEDNINFEKSVFFNEPGQ